jgi:hypothetical protein
MTKSESAAAKYLSALKAARKKGGITEQTQWVARLDAVMKWRAKTATKAAAR